LFSAALNGHLEIVKFLIESHADINAANNDGDTPLKVAASRGHLEIEKMLREAEGR